MPDGFHRIRHFGFMANGHRAQRLALCRSLLTDKAGPSADQDQDQPAEGPDNGIGVEPPPCSECGGVMRFVAHVPRGSKRPDANAARFWCDTS